MFHYVNNKKDFFLFRNNNSNRSSRVQVTGTGMARMSIAKIRILSEVNGNPG